MKENRKYGDTVWVWSRSHRPCKAKFLARVLYGSDETAVHFVGASLKVVRTRDVFDTEKEAMVYTLKLQKYDLKRAGWALETYTDLLEELGEI